MDISRREFFGSTLASVGALTLPSVARAAAADGKVVEPTRELPVAGDFDVIVAGGGPAGIAAAVASARAGKRTALFETHGCLGGIWTAGLVGCMLDFDKCWTSGELIRRLEAAGAKCRADRNWFHYEPEYMKAVCEDLCVGSGVAVRLLTSVVAAVKDASGRNIRAIVTESKSGREAWTAKAFVDATGDGDLAARADCGFDLGLRPDGVGQPASLDALVIVEDADALAPFTMYTSAKDPRGALRAEMLRAGVEPSYSIPTMYRLHDHLMVLMSNHEYGVRVDDAAAISAATIRARREVHAQIAALAKLGGVWKGIRVAATAEQIGHRSARRIHGRYTLTREDVVSGARFPDAVCESRYPADIHALDAKTGRVQAADTESVKWKPFQIPLRALRAKDIDNLWMGGRCISGDPIAHASYRVTGSAVATGEAAGRAAALGANHGPTA